MAAPNSQQMYSMKIANSVGCLSRAPLLVVEEFKAKKFKKSAILGLWTVLMHLILRGLCRKHGGADTMSKDRLYVVYSIYSGKTNVVNLAEVLWRDFQKFVVKRKPLEILSQIL